MSSSITPGLLVLHGNRLEDLRAITFDWIAQHPLDPLEEAIFLVQSNGIAEWLKVALAQDLGICAATRIELPARLLWRCYRQMLGRAAVPAVSGLDKGPLTWRLMRLLPGLLAQTAFAPLQRFLSDGDALRRFQLAERLADLFDQYQVYRADWLEDWAQGRDGLRRADGQLVPLGADQLWQAALWRAVLADLPEAERATGRASIHRRFVAALESGAAPVQPLPRRVVLFGAAALPLQTLEALAALSHHCQVILAIPNPCQYHWADIIDGRELLRAERRRLTQRSGPDLATIPLEALHAHSHPLLAGWGRLGRDFIRLLDEFDDTVASQARFNLPRIDLFDEGPGNTLLEQVQARIRDLAPLDADDRPLLAATDRSIVFHIGHSALREVEILHDQLLALLADNTSDKKLAPRDIVVMVPDIETFAPAIRAVFSQYAPHDARHIPYAIADQKNRGVNPLLCALEWLLALPEQRCTAGEIRDLLDVPALAQRFDLAADALPRLAQWIAGAGIRWGLSTPHRASLGLAACGEQNSWLFGLKRMLLGYANGEDGPFAGIEPYGEVGGLDAALAGSLAMLVDRLQQWRVALHQPARPNEWGERLRRLLQECFAASDERDRLTLAALDAALQNWLSTCADSDFAAAVPLAVVREAWLAGVDEPTLNQRFLGAGVTFCTLMPMRAIPFAVVCLLGMNDGDYPRSTQRADFDLLAAPGQQRPGDRSRRDDDRYLMLEALLAARQQLYISWTGRSARDNSEQHPSVLVSQLRDYLAAGWSGDVLAARTTEHPLQPFSRRYFAGDELFTWASEWRSAHVALTDDIAPDLTTFAPEPAFRLTLALLSDFLKNPVKHFFRHRLDVVFQPLDSAADDDEPFGINPLEEYGLVSDFLDAARLADVTELPMVQIAASAFSNTASPFEKGGLKGIYAMTDQASAVEIPPNPPFAKGGIPSQASERAPFSLAVITQQINQHADRIARSGQLPIGPFGPRARQHLVQTITPVWQQWQALSAEWTEPATPEALHFTHAGLVLEDWLDGLRQSGDERAWLKLDPALLCDKKQQPRAEKLIAAWLRQLVASACGLQITGIIVGRDALLRLAPLEPAEAVTALRALIDAWHAGMDAPLPLASQTALAFLDSEFSAREIYEGGFRRTGEVEKDPALARAYPDYEALLSDGQFPPLAQQLFGPLRAWIDTCVSVTIHDATVTDGEDDDEPAA